MKQEFFPLVGLAILAVIMVSCSGQKEAAKSSEIKRDKQGYIEKYRNIAVQEMRRTGIPASITLAQGILESGYGQSRLAKEANNHFGIKCHDSWDGPSVREDDDKKNECFRKYDIPERSYIDHSKFLTTRPRYSFLFEYDKTAYKKWARGLKEAGYATNPDYANELIELIEEYNLHEYDKMERGDLEDEEAKDKVSTFEGEVVRYNNIKAVVAQSEQSWLDIAKEHETRLNRLHKYNDYYARYFEKLVPGEKVYLQPKRKKGDKTTHKVKKGETMYFISQEHGIRLEKLYKRNKMEKGEEPKVGEKLMLEGQREEKPAIKTQKQLNKALSTIEEERKEKKQILADDTEESDKEVKTDNLETDVNERTDTTSHIVSEGETLYSISHQYYVPVNQVKSVNNLGDSSLEPGQTLTIPPNAQTRADQEKKTDQDTATAETMTQEPAGDEDTTTTAADKGTDEKDGKQMKEKQEARDDEKGTMTTDQEEKQDTASNDQSTQASAEKEEKDMTESTDESTPTESQERAETEQAEPATATTNKEANTNSSKEKDETGSTIVHVVKAGETLFRISQQYGADVKKIKQLNDLSSNNLAVGQKLKIPGKKGSQTGNKVTSEENTIPAEPPDDAKSITIHVVKDGETLYSISQSYNKSVDDIVNANDNLKSQNIEVGQKIKIPQEEEADGERQEEKASSSSGSEQTHTVQSGETLYSISQKYDVSVEKLKALNDLSSTNLRVGQELTIEKE